MTHSKRITIGEATSLVQGYPTQVWVPTDDLRGNKGVALVHDRRVVDDDPGAVYLIPGNNVKKQLLRPGREAHEVIDESGNTRILRIPDALLWSNHGGPCERDGARYSRIPEKLMLAAYRNLIFGGQTSVMPPKLMNNGHYVGPYDYEFPRSTEDRLVFKPISSALLMGAGLIWSKSQ